MQIDDSDLDYLLAEDLLPDTGQTLALDRTADAWEDQGYWLVLLLLPVALGLFRRGWILCLLPLLLVLRVWRGRWMSSRDVRRRPTGRRHPLRRRRRSCRSFRRRTLGRSRFAG